MRKLFGLGLLCVLGLLSLLAANAGSTNRHAALTRIAPAAAGAVQGEDKNKKEEKKKPEEEEEPRKVKGPFKNLKYRLVGPAAGGRVSRACGIPGDPSTYYLAAASGGVWKTNDGGLNWKPIFDEESTSSMGAIAVAPSDPNVIYAGSGEANIRGNVEPGNGIYRSTNGGKTWKHVWKQRGQIGRIIVHPTNPEIAYAAVLGTAFQPETPSPTPRPGIHEVLVNGPERGVYRTTDGGRTWQQVLSHKAHVGEARVYHGPGREHNWVNYSAHVGAIDICFDPANPRILLAALWQAHRSPWSLTSGGEGSGLYRSEDAGDTWKKFGPKTEKERAAADEEDNGLPEGIWGRVGIAIAPSDSRRIYALIEADKGGLYRSDDAGENWKLVNSGHYLRQRAWYFSQVAVDPANADIVWCSNVRLLKSIDGGHTFKNFKGPHHPDHHDLWIDPKNPRRMIDSNDGGVDITRNGGESWFAPPLPICQFYHVNCDNSVPYRVMGCMQDQGTASGPSNSRSSAGISLSDWINVGGGETGFAVPDPSDPNIVYAGEYGGYISRFDLRTRQAANISIYPVNPSGKGAADLKYRFQWTAPILVSPHDPKAVYHAANVLFRTRDGGTTWEKISPDLTTNDRSKQQWSGGPITGDNTGAEYYCTIFAIAESPVQTGILWAGSDDGLVHVSRDDGKTWTNVTKNIPNMPTWGTVTCIEASHFDAGTAYVVVDSHRLDDHRPYLWQTTDFGKTWTSLTKGLRQDDFLKVIREDPLEPGLLYAGSAHHVSFKHRGKDWESLKLNMPSVLISDLVVKDDDLVVGTNGRSVWILDDLTPIRRWQDQEKWSVSLFPPPTATRWRYHGENYAGEDRIPGENPPKGAIITYHLDKKPKGEVLLEVFDSTGKRVRKLTSKKQEPEAPEDAPDVPWSIYKPTVLPDEPGLQRIAWDLRRDGPKIIPGAKNDAGTPHEGPMVLPGTYRLKLSVDGAVSESKVRVVLDPRVKLSPKDLDERQALALKIEADISKLAETVLALRSVREQIQQRIKVEPNAVAWVKDAEAVLPKLDALEERLHNPKAEVTYDILAQKGGAKLYSQLTPLYYTLMESDSVVTQGVREVYAEHAKELRKLEAEWRALVSGDVARLNQQARNLPAIVVPGMGEKN